MENITKERIWELLNILIDKMIEDEGMKVRAVIMNLLELGFTRNEIIELNFSMSEVCDLADEYEG